jgi:hypothetical protein
MDDFSNRITVRIIFSNEGYQAFIHRESHCKSSRLNPLLHKDTQRLSEYPLPGAFELLSVHDFDTPN